MAGGLFKTLLLRCTKATSLPRKSSSFEPFHLDTSHQPLDYSAKVPSSIIPHQPKPEHKSKPVASNAFFIPEILEQILYDVPWIELVTTCRAVCKVWREVLDTSPTLKRYKETGERSPLSTSKTDEPDDEIQGKNIIEMLTPAAILVILRFQRRLAYFCEIDGILNKSNLPCLGQVVLWQMFNSPTIKSIILFRPLKEPITCHQVSIVREKQFVDVTEIVDMDSPCFEHGYFGLIPSSVVPILRVICFDAFPDFNIIQIGFTFNNRAKKPQMSSPQPTSPPVHTTIGATLGPITTPAKTPSTVSYDHFNYPPPLPESRTKKWEERNQEPGALNILCSGHMFWETGELWQQFPFISNEPRIIRKVKKSIEVHA
ncbi:hypothetical protein ABW20_dc0104228 [Dactylellina cionopaga]|nr:hypothetical protein ABW20_dc0104228 [Dactylellina cionopaga]